MSEPSANGHSQRPSASPPPSPEELARRLKAQLAKERPQTFRLVLALVAITVGILAFLAWFLRPQPEPGRWTVVAFDDWSPAGVAVPRRARLEPATDADPGSHRGLEIFFRGSDRADAEYAPFGVDAKGEAVANEEALAAGSSAFLAAYLGPQRRYKAEDRGRHFFYRPDARLLAVDVEETVADLPGGNWSERHLQSIFPQRPAAEALAALAKKGSQVVYFSRRIGSARDYQRVRTWIELQRAAGLPEGPLLARVPEAKETPEGAGQRYLTELRKRWTGPLLLVVGSEEGAAAGKTAGIATYRIGEGAAPAGVLAFKGWPEAAAELKKGAP